MRTQQPDPPTLLESKDAARLLGVSPHHVRMLARLGVLEPSYRTPRGSRLYRAENVLRLRGERERKGSR